MMINTPWDLVQWTLATLPAIAVALTVWFIITEPIRPDTEDQADTDDWEPEDIAIEPIPAIGTPEWTKKLDALRAIRQADTKDSE
jgi:hypothetical protein